MEGGVGDDGVGDVAEAVVGAAGVVAQEGERGVDVDVVNQREGAFGLFDGDSAVQGALELFGEDLAGVEGSSLEESDGDASARAWMMRTSSGSSLPTSVLNRFIAPITVWRWRSGKACTDRNPALTAWARTTASARWRVAGGL